MCVLLLAYLAPVLAALEESNPLLSPPIFDVTFFGAQGDGQTDDTQAVLTAWEAACLVPSSIVYFPGSYSFMIGFAVLYGPCAEGLTVQVDGTIVAKEDINEWRSDIMGWLVFTGLQSFRLTGYGVIDGRGDFWWALSCKNYPSQALLITQSSNVEISYLTIKDSQEFHLSIESCTDVYMSGLQIYAPSDSPNTDGIHITRSQNVYIQNTLIGTGDDCISIQTESYNINIEGVTCGPGHGVSIGGLGKDNSFACVAGVYVRDLVMTGAQNGLRIKTWQGGAGAVHDVHFESVTMNDVENPIIIDQFYCDSSFPCDNQTYAVQIHNIHFKNIQGSSRTEIAVHLACSDTFPCENISLEDVSLVLSGTDEPSNSFCWNAFGVSYGDQEPLSCLQGMDERISDLLQTCIPGT